MCGYVLGSMDTPNSALQSASNWSSTLFLVGVHHTQYKFIEEWLGSGLPGAPYLQFEFMQKGGVHLTVCFFFFLRANYTFLLSDLHWCCVELSHKATPQGYLFLSFCVYCPFSCIGETLLPPLLIAEAVLTVHAEYCAKTTLLIILR